MGDLGEIPDESTLEKLRPIDILFVPVGDIFTIGAEEAKELAEKMGVRVVIPMHYRVRGLSLSIKGVDDFLALYEPDQVSKVGNEIDFPPEDLPKKQEVWLFTI